MISPVRSGWPTMLPRTQNRSPMAACISPLPHPRCPCHPCTAAARSPVCHITMASIHLALLADTGHLRAPGDWWARMGSCGRECQIHCGRSSGENGSVNASSPADLVRHRLGGAIFQRVAGPEGRERHRLINAPGERWFAEDRPIRRVHGDSSMFIGGITALLLQSLHPLAMAAVAGHSGYRGDPWGRLQRTSYFLAITTFGRASDAGKAIARVRAIHRKITGTAPDGRPYAASDPHLLTWVHIAEADSFLRAHARFGAHPLDQAGRDGYVADLAKIGAELGVPDPPRTEADLTARIASYRAELVGTAQSREAARFLLLTPPLPAVARPPYTVLAAVAVSLLPGWARQPLRMPRLPVTEAAVVRPAGHALVHAIRWAITPPPPVPSS